MSCLKRCLLPFFALLLTLGCLLSVALAEERETVRVGYLNNYGFYSDSNSATGLSGYCYDYLMKLAGYAGWKCEFIPMSWDEGLGKLATGEIDLFGPLQKTPERELVYEFPSQQMGYEHGALYVESGSRRVFYNDTSSMDGLRVGTEPGNYYIAPFQEFCRTNGISVTMVQSTVSDFAEGLTHNEIDAFLAGGLLDIPNSTVVAKISTEPYYFAATKGNTRLTGALDAALEKILLEDAYFDAKLDQKYYGSKSISMPAFTREEQAFIDAHPTLTVAYDPAWSPVEYYDKASKGFTGINVALLDAIGEVSGLQFQAVQVNSYEGSKALAQAGRVDLLMGYTNPPDAAELGVTYTVEITEIPMMLVGAHTIDFSSPLNVALREQDSPISSTLIRQYPNFHYEEYDGINEIIRALAHGDVDAAFLSTYVFDEFARKQPSDSYISVPTKITFPQCIGVTDALPSIAVDVLNKAIHRLTPDQISTIIFANTVGRAYTVPASRILKENSLAIIVVLALFFAAILALSLHSRRALAKVAYVDTLTGLPTLARFRLDAQSALRNARPSEFILVALDIDDFKYINDSFGYNMGNLTLLTLARHFKDSLSPGELLARTGADNFIFLVRADSLTQLRERAGVLQDIYKHIDGILSEHYSLAFSAGVYHIVNTSEDFSLILDKANFARKSVKGDNILTIAEYTCEMDQEIEWKKAVTLSMEHALLNREFEVYLQPKYMLRNERLVGAEALIRWNHPERGLLAPAMFIPIFEQNGFIRQLDMYVFEEVCALLNRWNLAGKPMGAVNISVNLSRLHLFNPTLAEDLLLCAARYDVPPSCIELELTESIVFHNTKLLIDNMNLLREAGFQISIDDFGSGYSSLNLLKDLPVDVLKIDKAFLSNSADVTNGRVIINSVTQMAKSLRLITVAEGVETQAQKDMLLGFGCDIAQGYLYAKPMPIGEFEKLM